MYNINVFTVNFDQFNKSISPTDAQEWDKPPFKQVCVYCIRPINNTDHANKCINLGFTNVQWETLKKLIMLT